MDLVGKYFKNKNGIYSHIHSFDKYFNEILLIPGDEGDFYIGHDTVHADYIKYWYTEVPKEEFMSVYNTLEARIRKCVETTEGD